MARLRHAVARQAPVGQAQAGMLLSGGMDSRVLLAILKDQMDLSTFPTFTWGIPNCDDARAAREVARRLGAPHHFYELKPDWLLDYAHDCVRATDGMGNLINLHARATLDQETQHARILYKGFLGDAMMGYAQQHLHWANYDPATALQAHLQVHRNQGVITFGPEEHDALFTPAFSYALGCKPADAVMDSYAAGMAESGATLLADQRITFDYRQRLPRHTLHGVQVARSRAVVRLPFADNDLIDLMLTVPPGLRYERRIMRNAFMGAYPALARIPLPDTGLPMLDSARDIWLRTQRWLRWHLGRVSPIKMDYFNFKPYKDYTTWFRTILRPWVEDTLLDQRTLQRGYFQPDAIRETVQGHMNGQNHTVRLGAFLTLELWQRQFID
jgi:asparagine synthase (glutamine-hydrolysing)